MKIRTAIGNSDRAEGKIGQLFLFTKLSSLNVFILPKTVKQVSFII